MIEEIMNFTNQHNSNEMAHEDDENIWLKCGWFFVDSFKLVINWLLFKLMFWVKLK
jgi:hypothetical protein